MFSKDSTAVQIAQALIRRPSVTPDDQGCQAMIGDFLTEFGFDVQHMPSGEVSNILASYQKQEGPHLMFISHTDVVPPGILEHWEKPPFEAAIVGDKLIGRGSVDTKGNVAAMLAAVRSFVQKNGTFAGKFSILLTSDEEKDAVEGTAYVLKTLCEGKNYPLDDVLIGEPSSANEVGDAIKHARRGSGSCTLTLDGIQSHSAYPNDYNVMHHSSELIKALSQIQWEPADFAYTRTTLQCAHIHSGDIEIKNVVPGQLILVFNIRFSSFQNAQTLDERVEEVLKAHLSPEIKVEKNWHINAIPFFSDPKNNRILDCATQAIIKNKNIKPRLETGGGSSDGRFAAQYTKANIIELGLRNETIHKVNEHTTTEDIKTLEKLYESLLEEYFLN